MNVGNEHICAASAVPVMMRHFRQFLISVICSLLYMRLAHARTRHGLQASCPRPGTLACSEPKLLQHGQP